MAICSSFGIPGDKFRVTSMPLRTATLLLAFILHFQAFAAIDDGVCTAFNKPCSNPRGGVCAFTASKISCECPKTHTLVKHSKLGGICKAKLLDIPCQRDNDFACLLVKDSLCTLSEARCICPLDYVYVPHRHQCKPLYLGDKHAYCNSCESEQGICFKEDDLTESNGPMISEGGKSFRLSCACTNNKGVPKAGKMENWVTPVCSTRLRDIEEECNDHNLLCRSKRAKCMKPRNVETDFRKCQCPDRFVPVYQPWLQYYECFEKLDIKAQGCEECSQADPYGICYSTNNSTTSSDTGCLCPKRISTPHINGGQNKLYCSKHHVSVTCQPNRMDIKFDPNYDIPLYDKLFNRLEKSSAVAFVEGYQQSEEVCLLRYNDKSRMYEVTLETDSDSVCGRRTVKKMDYMKKRLLLEATLKVLWNKNFYSYPDIVVDLVCTVGTDGLKRIPNVQIKTRKTSLGKVNNQPPPSLTGVDVSLRILNRSDRMITEIEEGDLIKLDVMLDDVSGRYSSLLIEQCLVSNRTNQMYDGSSSKPTRLVGCGGIPVENSGFTASFQGKTTSSDIHLQTEMFPAFRLGKVPFLYFSCTIRICKEDDLKFCHAAMCNLDRMAKRSPDDGIRWVDKEVHVVVTREHLAKRAENYSICQYSMCLSTSQVIIIILILLVLLALVSGLIIVVYRRRLLIAAHRLRLRAAAAGHTDDDTPTDTPIDSIHKSPLPPMTTLYSGPTSDTIDSAFGGSLRTYASMTLERAAANAGMCPDHHRLQQQQQACLMTSALLGDSRPDVCTCDRPLHRSYSITSSQV